MLQSIWIKNYILIEELSLSFEQGMSAFTGETGAGKSILIDALSLLCGARATSDMVAQNTEKALIEGVFTFNNEHTLQLLQDAGFSLEDEYVVTREITAEGKSSARLNHRPITLAFLRELFDNEVDIHSQRDTQYLLNSNTHLDLIDNYGVDSNLLTELNGYYTEYRKQKLALEEALQTTYNEDELAFLQFQLQEIIEANLDEEEEEQLLDYQKQMAAYEKTSLTMQNSLLLLKEDKGVIEKLEEALKLLTTLDVEVIQEPINSINNQYYELVEATSLINDYYSTFEYDEEKLNQTQERLFKINTLKRKYGGSIKEVLLTKLEIEQKISLIENKQEYLLKAEKELNEAWSKYENLALHISGIRNSSALDLEKEIRSHLVDLALPHAQFKVEIQRLAKDKATKKGLDQIEFYISMNPGEPLRPLNKVASGGELSRLMLGLKTVFSKLYGLSTIVFDEIDSGVSGSIATAIGLKMRALSSGVQVFVVTHLAQVAATSNHHYHVYKEQLSNQTKTIVKALNNEEIIIELAKLSTGTTSDNALATAKEMWETNQSLAKSML